MMEIETSPFAFELVTLIVAVPMTVAPLEDFPEAVMVAVPALTAVAMPPFAPFVMVATLGALEDHVTCVVRSCETGWTPVYAPMATNFAVWPRTVIGWAEGTTEIEVRPVYGVAVRSTVTVDVA